MVHTYTFILVILCFVITTFVCEKYFIKNPPQFGIGKLLLLNILIEFILLTFVVVIPSLFPILIYGNIIIACYVCAFSRHKKIGEMPR